MDVYMSLGAYEPGFEEQRNGKICYPRYKEI